MRRLKKAFWSLLLTLVITVTSFACFSDPDSGKEIIKIGFLKAGFGSAWIEGIAQDYMTQNPNVAVKLEGSYQMPSIVGARMGSGKNLSDIFYAQPGVWQKWVVEDKIEPLDDLFARDIDGTIYKDKLQEGIKDSTTLYGHPYAVPHNDNISGFVYNVNMFTQKGWDVPKTVTQMNELIAKIKKDGSTKPFVFCGKSSGGYWDFPMVTWWAQYEGIENINTFLEYDTKEGYYQEGRKKSLETLYSILSDSKNYVSGAMALDNIEAQTAFIQGQAAMIPCASYFETEMKAALKANPDFKVGMMACPSLDGAKTDEEGNPIKINYTGGGEVFFVPKGAKNKTGAKDFLAFMAKDSSLQYMLEKMNTPQPFIFDVTPVKPKLSDFGKMCIEIWESSYNLTMWSDNPMYLKGKVGLWPTPGFHQTRMVSDPVKYTGNACYLSDIDIIETNWDAWRKECGLD